MNRQHILMEKNSKIGNINFRKNFRKNSLQYLKFEMAEETISELQDRSIEMIQSEGQRK